MLILELESAQAFENGERSGKHGAAIWQLQHPDPHNPTYLMNATPKLFNNAKMCVPNGLLRKRTPYKEPIFTANLTPMHTVVDLHLDQCRDGLIQCIGHSKKMILMWPIAESNRQLMRDHSNHRMKFVRMGHLLQGGIITILDSSVGLVMSTGTIHMTITLEAGVLVGLNWVAAECHRAGARCFEYEICANLENDFSNVLGIYADQLEASLNGWDEVRHQEVLEDWMFIYPLLVTACNLPSKETVVELQRGHQALERFLQSPQALRLSDDFRRNFQDAHMKELNLLIEAGRKASRRVRNPL